MNAPLHPELPLIGFAQAQLMQLVNGVVFGLSVVLALSDNVGVAFITGAFTVINTFLILRSQREHKKTREDLQARRLVVVKYGDGDDETVVITPEERRALGSLRHDD